MLYFLLRVLKKNPRLHLSRPSGFAYFHKNDFNRVPSKEADHHQHSVKVVQLDGVVVAINAAWLIAIVVA